MKALIMREKVMRRAGRVPWVWQYRVSLNGDYPVEVGSGLGRAESWARRAGATMLVRAWEEVAAMTYDPVAVVQAVKCLSCGQIRGQPCMEQGGMRLPHELRVIDWRRMGSPKRLSRRVLDE